MSPCCRLACCMVWPLLGCRSPDQHKHPAASAVRLPDRFIRATARYFPDLAAHYCAHASARSTPPPTATGLSIWPRLAGGGDRWQLRTGVRAAPGEVEDQRQPPDRESRRGNRITGTGTGARVATRVYIGSYGLSSPIRDEQKTG